MHDLLKDCMADIGERDAVPFREKFCHWCRNPDCVNAKWAQDRFSKRVANQADRLLNPISVSAHSPRYAILSDFPDMLREAMRLEVSDRRSDWEVPEIPILDGRIERTSAATTMDVDRAMQQLAASRGVDIQLPVDPEPSEPLQLDPAEPPRPPVPRGPLSVPATRGAVGNTPVPEGGLMIGGGPTPQKNPDPVDPWAPKPVVQVVPRGARIRMGGSEPSNG